MNFKVSLFFFTLLLPALKLPVVGFESGLNVAADAHGEFTKSGYLIILEFVKVFISNLTECHCPTLIFDFLTFSNKSELVPVYNLYITQQLL